MESKKPSPELIEAADRYLDDKSAASSGLEKKDIKIADYRSMHRMIEEDFVKCEKSVLDADKEEFADFTNKSKDEVYQLALETGKALTLRLLSGKVYFKR